jgi:hypothetical protein
LGKGSAVMIYENGGVQGWALPFAFCAEACSRDP